MDDQLELHPSGLTRSQFNLLVQYSENVSSMSAAQLQQAADRHLSEVHLAYQSNRLVNVRMATAIRDTIEKVTSQWDELPPGALVWLAGAVLYFANSDDDEADLTSPIGFEDDVEVLNACLRFARLEELCLISEDYDDV